MTDRQTESAPLDYLDGLERRLLVERQNGNESLFALDGITAFHIAGLLRVIMTARAAAQAAHTPLEQWDGHDIEERLLCDLIGWFNRDVEFYCNDCGGFCGAHHIATEIKRFARDRRIYMASAPTPTECRKTFAPKSK